jgi:hypothetical protein
MTDHVLHDHFENCLFQLFCAGLHFRMPYGIRQFLQLTNFINGGSYIFVDAVNRFNTSLKKDNTVHHYARRNSGFSQQPGL